MPRTTQRRAESPRINQKSTKTCLTQLERCLVSIFYDIKYDRLSDVHHTLKADLEEVKLIISNALLTYVYANTIKTYLTLNHCCLADSSYVILIQHQLWLGI